MPNDLAWPNAAARAVALAAASALDLAADLSRRSNILIAVAPKLRSKPAQKIVDLLLARDCLSPAEAARHAPMTGRAARRLFDRLVCATPRANSSGRPTRLLRPMTAGARRRPRSGEKNLDVELADLPPAARWREWMLRVEAAIFAFAEASCRANPSPAWRRNLPVRRSDRRSHPRVACVAPTTSPPSPAAMRCTRETASPRRSARPIPDWEWDDVAELTRTETFALTAIAYLQPVTRGEISRLAGREISRDIIAALRRATLV